MIALTATATKLTKDTIFNFLLKEKPYENKESSNKLNVTYKVECIDKDTGLEFHFEWLVEELKTRQSLYERTTITQCCSWHNQRYAWTAHVCRQQCSCRNASFMHTSC